MRVLTILFCCLMVTACAAQGEPELHTPTPRPSLPADIETDANGVPALSVYLTDRGTISPMDIETYVTGVVAGEMKNDWPIEALKAQAILARTFVLRFVAEKSSKYEGADISTDIAEAQAYNEENINDAIRQAVRDTEGQVLVTAAGTLPYTWFHAHSGGMTALAKEGLGWNEAEPSYTRVTEGLDSPDAPDDAKSWEADFPAAEFLAACRRAGSSAKNASAVSINEKGRSGRAVTLLVGGQTVDAVRLRVEIGSTIMRSTLLTELSVRDGSIHMAGLGYGHGVGMPQWGAYALAQDGLTGEDIALHYYDGLSLVKMW